MCAPERMLPLKTYAASEVSALPLQWKRRNTDEQHPFLRYVNTKHASCRYRQSLISVETVWRLELESNLSPRTRELADTATLPVRLSITAQLQGRAKPTESSCARTRCTP